MENTKTAGIGVGIAVAIAVGRMGLQKPIATPIPMIATQSGHDLPSSSSFLDQMSTYL